MVGSNGGGIHCAGVDLGLSGGIVALNSSREIVFRAPMKRREEPRRSTVHSQILEMVETFGTFPVVIEQPPMAQGGATNANAITGLWREFGLILAAVDFLSLPFTTVPPQTWQSRFWKSAERKRRGWTTKEMAREAVEQFFPGYDWRPPGGVSADHDGTVDAALLALWGMTAVFI